MRLKPLQPVRLTRRELLKTAAAVAVAGLLFDGTELERHRIEVVEKLIRLPNLGSAFHGFRIVQLSDFHFRRFDEPAFLAKVIRRVNALEPQMVAMTGDFITASHQDFSKNYRDTAACAEILRDLTAPLRFCSLGNHDTIDIRGSIRALQAAGLLVLNNRYAGVELRGDRLWIGGVADAYFDTPDLSLALPQDRMDAPLVLLGHEPDFADTVAPHGGVSLMLAGHTHGGQVRLPGLPPMFLPTLGRKYVHGLFDLGGMQLYVNRGLGAVHVPIRFRCPPEITVFTLISA